METEILRLDTSSQPRKTQSPYARVNVIPYRHFSAPLEVIRLTTLESSMETLNTPLEHQRPALPKLLVTLTTTTWLQPLVEQLWTV